MSPSSIAAGRLLAALATLLLAVALLTVAPPPAAAAAPWRFTEVADSESLPINTTTPVIVSCPGGYFPVGGGVASVGGGPETTEIMGAYVNGSAYQVNVHNGGTGSNTATVNVVCADVSQLGFLDFISVDFARDPTTGFAAGTATCGGTSRALIGGADWSSNGGSNRRIDFQGPTVSGAAWQAYGWSPNAGAILSVEAYCIPEAAIGAAVITTNSTTYTSQIARAVGQVACAAGRRPGSGGIEAFSEAGGPGAGNFLGNDWYSAPSVNQPVWNTNSWVEANVTLRRNVWCLPAGQPTIQFTQTPPDPTSSGDATFAYTLGDTAGEPRQNLSCELDNVTASCSPTGATVSGLTSGEHTFEVTVENTSYQTTTQSVQWTVDQIPPELITPIASPPIAGPITVVFDEPVTGLNGLEITEVGRSTPLAGSVMTAGTEGGGMAAVFTPSQRLIPGQRYDVAVSEAVEDLAGNPIAAQTEQVRAAVSVQNTSHALTESWDRDTNAMASGGGFIESSTAGSRATWNVTTAADQSVVLTGVKRPDGGFAKILIDGVKAKRVSFYKATTGWQATLFTSAPLAAGPHTITVQVEGTKGASSSGTWVMLDAVTVDTTVIQETSAAQRFRRVAAEAASGGSYDTVIHRTNSDTGGGPKYQLTFGGVGATGYVTKTPGSGAVDVFVDGVKKVSNASLASGTVTYGAVGFTVSGLTAGRHTLRVVPVGTGSGGSSAVGLDRIVVN